MAIFHLRVSTISRARGQSAVACSCYRAGGRRRDKRLNKRFDYRAKERSIVATWLTGWRGTASELWNKAEAAEKRKDATVAREIQVSIPRELNDEQGIELCRRFSTLLVEVYGVAVETSIHRPGGKAQRDRNPHAHILMTCRRSNPLTGELEEKTREWDARAPSDAAISERDTAGRGLFGRACVDHVREAYERLANEALTANGTAERIDRRTLAARGIEREPVSRSRATLELENRGLSTAQGTEMAERAKRNIIRQAKAAVGRALPVQHIETIEIAETPVARTAPKPARQAPPRDDRREMERREISARYRAAKELASRTERPKPAADAATAKLTSRAGPRLT